MSNNVLDLEKEHPKLKLFSILIKAAELIGADQQVAINNRNGDVVLTVTMKGFVEPEKAKAKATKKK